MLVAVSVSLVDDVLDAASIIRCGGGSASGAVRRLAAPAARPQHPMTLAACNTATRHVPPALALAPSFWQLEIRRDYISSACWVTKAKATPPEL